MEQVKIFLTSRLPIIMCTTRISEYESGWELLEKLKVNKIGKFTGLYKVICLKEFLLIDYIKKGKF